MGHVHAAGMWPPTYINIKHLEQPLNIQGSSTSRAGAASHTHHGVSQHCCCVSTRTNNKLITPSVATLSVHVAMWKKWHEPKPPLHHHRSSTAFICGMSHETSPVYLMLHTMHEHDLKKLRLTWKLYDNPQKRVGCAQQRLKLLQLERGVCGASPPQCNRQPLCA